MKCVLILAALVGFCAAEFCRNDQVSVDCVDTKCGSGATPACHNGVCTCEQSHDHSCKTNQDCSKDGSSACTFHFGSVTRNGHWHCSTTRNRCYCLPGSFGN